MSKITAGHLHGDQLAVAAHAALPFVAYAFSHGVIGAEEAGRNIEDAILNRSPTYTPQQVAAGFRAGQSTERMQQAEQVGEAQGDGLVALESAMPYLETLHSIVGGEARTSVWRCIERGRAALAARQPGAQEPYGWIVTGPNGSTFLPVAARETMVVCAKYMTVVEVYTAPPAQGIDLGRALDIMWNWQEQLGGHVFDARDVARTLTSSDMQAIGVDARACIDATDRNQAIVLAKREIVRALSGGQRDAAPGVGVRS